MHLYWKTGVLMGGEGVMPVHTQTHTQTQTQTHTQTQQSVQSSSFLPISVFLF